ncbi:MAG: hypothetical protein AAGI28_11705 [Pseudomonadota bacterium]
MDGREDDNFESHFQKSKRVAPRLPLSLLGKLLSILGDYNCIVTNLSRTGVLIAIEEPLKVGSDGFLRCGPIDHFVTIKREGPGLNAAMFEIPVNDAFVAQVRHYQEEFAELELEDLRARAQEYTGVGT